MNWMELAVDTTPEGAELVANVFCDAGIPGVAIEDPGDVKELMLHKEGWDYIDSSLLCSGKDGVTVKGYLPVNGTLGDRLEMVREYLAALLKGNQDYGSLDLAVTEVMEEDWAHGWKRYYKPIKIGQTIVIKPSWEAYEPGRGQVVIELDPGMAFGTGTHESTALCIRLLERFLKPGCRAIDIGCGSGILAITAAKLGAGHVEAYDVQQLAVDVAVNNVRINGVEDVVTVERGDLFEKVKGEVHLIVSNIAADVIIEMCGCIGNHLSPGGIFIASGIIEGRLREVCEAVERNDMEILEEPGENGWNALAARMKGQRL